MEHIIRERNQKLFKAVSINDIEAICYLIHRGVDIDAEFTIKDLIDTKIIDDYAATIIEKDFRFRETAHIIVIEETGPCISTKLTALHLAVLYGWKEGIIQLLKKGANPNKILLYNGDKTVLHLMYSFAGIFNNDNAYIKFDKEIIQLLLDYGADPNIPHIYGKTPLINALETLDSRDESYAKEIERLLINGANPKIKDNFGSALTHKLRDINYDKEPLYTIKIILNHYANPVECNLNSELKLHVNNNNELIRAIKNMNILQIEKLINQGISSNIRDQDGLSALHLAKDDYSITKLLLTNNANPNIKSWENGTTPLLNAVVNKKTDIAELLLEHGANPSIFNTNGLSPLYFSVTNRNNEMTELLVNYKANPDIAKQISVLFNILKVMYTKMNNQRIIQSIVEKIEIIVLFLKEKGVPLNNVLFYNSAITAEENGRIDIGRRIINLLLRQ